LDHKAWGGGCYQMISRYMRKPWDTSFVQEAKVFGVLKQAFP
jgi:hypothetical protein